MISLQQLFLFSLFVGWFLLVGRVCAQDSSGAICNESNITQFDIDQSGNLDRQEYTNFLVGIYPDCYNSTFNLTGTQNTTFDDLTCQCPKLIWWCSCDGKTVIDPTNYDKVCGRSMEAALVDGCEVADESSGMIEDCAQAMVQADADKNNKLTYEEFQSVLRSIHGECYNESMPSVIWPKVARAVCFFNNPLDPSCYDPNIQNLTFVDITGASNSTIRTNDQSRLITAVCIAMNPIALVDCNLPSPTGNETLSPTTIAPSTVSPSTPVVSTVPPTTASPTNPKTRGPTLHPTTLPPSTIKPTTSEQKTASNPIIGAAIGGSLAAIALIAVACYFFCCRNRDNENNKNKIPEEGMERPHSPESSQSQQRELQIDDEREQNENYDIFMPNDVPCAEHSPEEEQSTSVYTSTTSSGGSALAAGAPGIRESTERAFDTVAPEAEPPSQQWLSNLPREEVPPPVDVSPASHLVDGETSSTLIPDYKEMIGCYPSSSTSRQVLSVEGEITSTSGADEEEGDRNDGDMLKQESCETTSVRDSAGIPATVVGSTHNSGDSNLLPEYKDQVGDHRRSVLPNPTSAPSDITFSQASAMATLPVESVAISVLSDSTSHEQLPLATAHPLDASVATMSTLTRTQRIPADPEGTRYPTRNRRYLEEMKEEEEEADADNSSLLNTREELEQLQQRIRDLEEQVSRK